MMKRKYAAAITMAMAVALGATACSSKTADTATTAAESSSEADTAAKASTEETEAETSESETDEREEDFADGTVTAVEEGTLTVEVEEVGGMKFDISKATVNSDYDLGEGDEVSVTYYLDDAADVKEAVEVDVLYSAAEENADGDPVMTGIVEDATMNTVAVKDEADGQTYYFSTMIAQMVTGEDGLTVGDEVQLTYLGEAGDEEYPGLAVKVVTSDMYDSEEAQVSTLTGVVSSVGDGRLDMETEDGNIFNFVDQGADFSMASEGDTVTVVYEGSLAGHEIAAVGME